MVVRINQDPPGHPFEFHADEKELKMQASQESSPETLEGTILIADDDRWLNTVLEARCSKLGLTVVAVEDALTALSSADFANPDLVILDVEMPGGNGLAACEMIRTAPETANIPVVILTGRTDADTIQRCRNLNAHYVQKGTDAWPQIELIIRKEIPSNCYAGPGFPHAR